MKITSIFNNVFRLQKTLKKTRLKLCLTLAFPALLYSSENWTIKAREKRRLTAEDIKGIWKTAEYSWTDHKTNTEIAKELNIVPLLDTVQDYRRNWIWHISRMPCNSLPWIIKDCTPKGRLNQGIPLKRLLDVWDWNGSTSFQTPW